MFSFYCEQFMENWPHCKGPYCIVAKNAMNDTEVDTRLQLKFLKNKI